MRRRLVFSTPLVVITACGERPGEHRPRPRIARVTPDAGPSAPNELVDELPPLSPDRTRDDACRHSQCNPPPPTKFPSAPGKPEPVEPVVARVTAMKREPAGTRVRMDRPDERMDEKWRATFITRTGFAVPQGDCTIVAWSFYELECTSPLAPEQLAEDGSAFHLRVVPPQELVDRIERQRRR